MNKSKSKKKEARYPKAKYPSFLALILECFVRAVIIAVVLYTLYNTASFKSPQGGWGDSIIAIVLSWWVFAPIIDFWIKVRNFNEGKELAYVENNPSVQIEQGLSMKQEAITSTGVRL